MDSAPQEASVVSSSSKALVVDDEATNRLLLRSILGKCNFEVLEAENGAEAVRQFKEASPDIVFMDAMMPVMDGYEAATAIKELAGDRFVPIIFLTALTDKESLARCIDAGGDDFLTKPISSTLLKAKIRALERIRDLQREVWSLYDQMRHDEEIAETVFEQIVRSHSEIVGPRYHVSPAGVFSGDMYLAEKSPSGGLNVLLGDFTGHGLSAALGAMPASDAFRGMSRKGFAPEQIINQINEKLCRSLPSGMFMALQFVNINDDLGRVTVCNCGMPDVLVVDGKTREVKQRVKSAALPLGVTTDLSKFNFIQYISVEPGDHILLASDGVVEAQSPTGDYFGESRYEQAVKQTLGQEYILDGVLETLGDFCEDAKQADDISVVDIPFNQELIASVIPKLDVKSTEKETAAPVPSESSEEEGDAFEVALSFQGGMLAKVDPVPMVLSQIGEVLDLEDHKNVLYTILSELYNNALDHGVLGLDSSLKNGAEGFAEYYSKRESMLSTLTDGQVDIVVNVTQSQTTSKVLVRLQDSGNGFDHQKLNSSLSDRELLSRRGVPLVLELCDSVNYEGSGNIVEALYKWSADS